MSPVRPSPSAEDVKEMAEGVLDHLTRQAECFREIVGLLPAQREATQKQDVKEVHRILSERDHLLARLAKLQNWLRDVGEKWKQYRPLVPEHVRRAIEDRVAETQKLAEEVFTADRSSIETIDLLKNEARCAVETFRESTQSSTGYYAFRKPGARFIDARK